MPVMAVFHNQHYIVNDGDDRLRLFVSLNGADTCLQYIESSPDLYLGYCLDFMRPLELDNLDAEDVNKRMAEAAQEMERRGKYGWFRPSKVDIAMLRAWHLYYAGDGADDVIEKDTEFISASPAVRWMGKCGIPRNVLAKESVLFGDPRNFIVSADNPFDTRAICRFAANHFDEIVGHAKYKFSVILLMSLFFCCPGSLWRERARKALTSQEPDFSSLRDIFVSVMTMYYLAWMSILEGNGNIGRLRVQAMADGIDPDALPPLPNGHDDIV